MFDPKKPVACRNGWAARIISTDVKGVNPIFALVLNPQNNQEVGYYYNALGQFPGGNGVNPYDLLNTKVKRWAWLYLKDGVIVVSEKKLTIQEAEKKYGATLFDKVDRTLEESDE